MYTATSQQDKICARALAARAQMGVFATGQWCITNGLNAGVAEG